MLSDLCQKSRGGCEGGLTETDYEAGFCTQCGTPLPNLDQFGQIIGGESDGEETSERLEDGIKILQLRGNSTTHTGE